MRDNLILAILLVVQIVSAGVFVSEIVISVFGLPFGPIAWQFRELIEIGAALGLTTGGMVTFLVIRQERRRTRRAEAALRVASGAFMDMLEERFDDWALTPAERDVALFAMKGLSTAEIAELRGVSDGTVKAQTAAIYRKAGVTGRPQLLSLFIEDLMSDPPAQAKAA